VLDSGGLTALVGRSQRARAWYRWIVEHDGLVVVPTAILVETTTGDGARDAEVNRVLAVIRSLESRLAEADEEMARRAGGLRYAARSDDGIDALVAAAAVGDGSACVLLTGDAQDLSALLAGNPSVSVVPV
jgi:hypothetical protein